ncbi:metallophosphoesterase [Ureibacillus composti]
MKEILQIALIVIIYGALTTYLGWNLKKWLQSLNLYRWPFIYWSIIYFVAFSVLFGEWFDFLHVFSIIGSYWMFLFEYGLILCVLVNLFVLITRTKRIKIMGTIVFSLLIVLFAFGTYNAYSPVVRNLEITIDKKGEPLRLVVASDFHLGILSDKEHLQKFVDLSNEAHPDVVLLVGDLVDDDPIWFVDEGMDDVMKQLKATYGVYGVLGNHEYYGGKIPLLVEEMKNANVKILMDETILVGNRFYLTGQEDSVNENRMKVAHLKPENGEYPWFVMNHTPNDLESPSNAGVDLHLSGHTHYGQLWPNNLITNMIFELDYGHMLKERMHALVSSGFGFWGPPTRIGSRSELWVIDVTFTKE